MHVFIPVVKGKITALNNEYSLQFTTSHEDSKLILPNGEMAYIVIIDEDDHYRRVIDKIWNNLKGAQLSTKNPIHFDIRFIDRTQIQVCFHGLLNSQYSGSLYKKEYKTLSIAEISDCIHIENKESFKNEINLAIDLASGQKICMDLLNKPANKKSPQLICEYIEPLFKELGVNIDIWDEKKSAKEGLHAFLSVNRGSEYPGRFVLLDYHPTGAERHIGLVGKGVTFDSGGISIKGSSNMHFMKSDMGGSTAILGALYSIAKQQLNIRVTAAIAFTDNAVDAKSIHPSDVIDSHSGQSIEIIDTDAEGRLCLADSLSYLISNYEVEQVLDLATLTGSVVQTLGYQAAGLFSDAHGMVQSIQSSSVQTGERVWPLPLWEEYKDDLDSDIADLKNFSGRKVAGAISAALFLKRFTHNHPNWAHLDIAGVAFGTMPYAQMRAATGYGVHLLFDWINGMVDS